MRCLSALAVHKYDCKGLLTNAQDVQNQEPDLKGILPNFVNYETDPSLKRHTALYTGTG